MAARARFRPPPAPAALLALLRSRLAAARAARGLSQLAASAAAGLSPSTVQLIEGGHRDPSLGTLAALAVALGTTPADLLAGWPPAAPPAPPRRPKPPAAPKPKPAARRPKEKPG